ncbi:MAG: carboxypeptidase-like regulatory domain-containing protein [Terracidiphilus sp.]
MAECSWTKSLARFSLLIALGASTIGSAQLPSGSLSGKLTDLYSRPLESATLTLRNKTTGAEARTTTTKGGVYRFKGIEPGDYSLEALSPGLGRGTIDGIEVMAGHEARMQIAVQLTPAVRRDAASVAPLRLPMPAPLTEKDAQPAVLRAVVRSAIRLPMHEIPDPSVPAFTVSLETEPLNLLSLSARSPSNDLQEQKVINPSGDIAELADPVPATSRSMSETNTDAPLLESALASIPLPGMPTAIVASRLAAAGLLGSSVTDVGIQAARVALQIAARSPKPVIETAWDVSDGVALATVLPATQLAALPLTGRNWQNFLPDASVGSGNSETENASSTRNGLETSAATVDGANTRLAFGGAGAGRMRGLAASLIGPGANEASIRQVEMGSGSVEAGANRGSRGRLNVETERGTGAFHGQGFLFDRGNLFGAQNPFTQWAKQTAPATLTTVPVFTPEPYTPKDQETLWGFGIGGRVYRRPLFWFVALDGLKRDNPGVSTVKHPDNFFAQPSNDQMQVLSARLGLSSANPVAEGLGAYSSMLETLDGLLGPAARTSSQWTGFGRLDWSIAERHKLTLEGTGALWDSPGGGLTRTSETYGTHSYGTSRADDQWILARWEAFLTPNLLAVTQGSVGRQFLVTPPETPSSYEQSLVSNAWGRLPQMTVDSRYGFTIGNPARFGPGGYPDEHLYEAQEQLNWVRGTMLVKAGIDFRHNNDGTGFLRNQIGTYDYASVENFASDALAFAAFGLNGQLNPMDQHNCDQTGKVWRDSVGTLHGLGYLPCYSWHSQTMGPANWWLSTDDWASYVTTQWQPKKTIVASLAIRWELEQSPPPMPLLINPDLPLTEKMPSLGSQWGPRASIAWGAGESHWPVLRLGYGMYFGRTPNATFETALTQTGSLKGDLNFFMRPTENLYGGGAPPFPYVLAGEPGTVVKPGAVEFAPGFRNGEVHQGVASIEETMPGHMHVDASAMASLGRRLPVTEDVNIDPAVNPQTITYAVVDGNGSGPLKTPQITVPFYASWPSSEPSTGFAGRLNPNYQGVTEIFSRANSTNEAAMLRVTRNSREGLTLHARYTYAHAMDWNPNESARVTGPSVFDPADFRDEYGTSDLDVRHSTSAAVIWEPRWKLQKEAARLANGWMLSGIGTFHSGLPYTMRTAGSLATEFATTGTAIVALAPGMNGYGGDNRVYGVGRNTYRYPHTWKADLRLAKHFNLGSMRQLELLAESFNLFNHQNVTGLKQSAIPLNRGTSMGASPHSTFSLGSRPGKPSSASHST